MSLLEVASLTKAFGGLKAVDDISFTISSGEIFGLIGPNGAGKTTVFNLLTGIYTPTMGQVVFNGSRIDGRKPYYITEKGIARTFQNIRLFGNMTVQDNVSLAQHCRTKAELIGSLMKPAWVKQEERVIHEKTNSMLQFVGLHEKRDELAKNLPYGEQRRLEIARALATSPALLLLDEPAAGMNPLETLTLMSLITKIRDMGHTILLIEHDMKVVMGISDRIAVLDYGKKIAEDKPEEIRKNPKVVEAYLGKGA
jgi:branched-chain amino acid transport system ATP-binding protein